MRSPIPLILGLAATAYTQADLEACLNDSGVPVDTVSGTDWARDAAPFNTRVPYTPATIAVTTTIEHIQAAVLCGVTAGVKVTPKSGGHSYASLGLGGEDGHLVVELDRMYDVTLESEDTGVAVVQPGARLGHLASVLWEDYGRGVAHGTCAGVGISGHFLHGGFGFSSHTHGLALDAILSATIVLANGSAVEASPTQNADLLWALKGAGSNFGIVASYRLQTFVPPPELTWFGASLGWTQSTAVAGLEALEAYARDEMPAEVNFRVSAYGYGGASIEGLYHGSEADMRAALAPLMETAAPSGGITSMGNGSWIDAVTHYAYTNNIDQTTPSAQENFYAKSLVLKGLNGTTAQAFVDYWYNNASQTTTRSWWFQMDMHGGAHSAISLNPNNASAYAHRDKLYMIQFYDRVYSGTYPTTGFALLDGWVAATTAQLPDDGADWGMYINYADTSLDRGAAQRLYYGENLPELQRLKALYDPGELFFYPQSIEPVVA
ncbi:Uu.00g113660.m01.CDS01 [Anthostomella pinea]|uniref:Uu.00g113660.m01.CDS01 n=1 Tax=Anthostomella pinea TaxID=933095 RepID=A0AAI8VFK3_9PEZI|nr:Uu.00g113660.m01.CDS01 [Anthostomella pinea]